MRVGSLVEAFGRWRLDGLKTTTSAHRGLAPHQPGMITPDGQHGLTSSLRPDTGYSGDDPPNLFAFYIPY